MNKSLALLPELWRVASVIEEVEDTVTLLLDPPAAQHVHFANGQFNMLYAYGIGEAPISISSHPEHTQLAHTIRGVGAVSRALCRSQPGDTIGLRGPFGTSWPLEKARGKEVLVIAGGIGLAPLRGLLHELHQHADLFGPIRLLYGARDPDTLLYPDERDQWSERIDVHSTVDFADSDWKHAIGIVTEIIPHHQIAADTCVSFICGPEVMIYFTVQALLDNGHNPDSIFVSMERNMQCAVGTCGHCQFGPEFICRDGPVFPWSRVSRCFSIREL